MLNLAMADRIEAAEVPAHLRALRARSGLSMEKLARAMDYANSSSYQRYEQEPLRPKFLAVEFVSKLAEVLVGLGQPPIHPDEVWALAGDLGGHKSLTLGDPIQVARQNVTIFAQRDLPIWGQSRAGKDGYFFDNGAEAHTFTYRPLELMNIRDAYAVYVNGNSMSPRFKHGELVYVDPVRPPAPGDDVVVQLADGSGYIKELVRRTERTVLCRQHQPPEEVEFAASEVRSVHLIVTATRVRV